MAASWHNRRENLSQHSVSRFNLPSVYQIMPTIDIEKISLHCEDYLGTRCTCSQFRETHFAKLPSGLTVIVLTCELDVVSARSSRGSGVIVIYWQ